MKSAVAREMFRRMAAERGVDVKVTSRGITPEDHMSPALSETLAKAGLDVRREPNRPLAQADLAHAAIIVVFDPLPGSLGSWPVRDWSDLPSMNADYPAASTMLEGRLSRLLDEIARENP